MLFVGTGISGDQFCFWGRNPIQGDGGMLTARMVRTEAVEMVGNSNTARTVGSGVTMQCPDGPEGGVAVNPGPRPAVTRTWLRSHGPAYPDGSGSAPQLLVLSAGV